MLFRTDPKDYVLHEGGDKYFVSCRPGMYEQNARKRGSWSSKQLLSARGDYDLAAVLEESVSDEPFTVEGCLIDLLTPNYRYTLPSG